MKKPCSREGWQGYTSPFQEWQVDELKATEKRRSGGTKVRGVKLVFPNQRRVISGDERIGD
jgi:hypothetical protein